MDKRLDLFIDVTNEALKELRADVKVLLEKENRRVGVVIAVSTFISLIFGIAELWLSHK